MNKHGFTLLELMIVIVILGVLAALISGNFITSLKKGRDAHRKEDLTQIQKSLEMYYEDAKKYPQYNASYTDGSLTFGNKLCNSSGCATATYMQIVPNDPIQNATYDYETDANGTYFKLYACLENDQQVLPYLSSPTSFTCSRTCYQPDVSLPKVPCIWGISSSNTTP